MKAGILNEKVRILRCEVERNEFNEQTDTYKPIAWIRASVSYKTGNRVDINHEVFYAYTKTFYIRRYQQINEFDRLEWKGKQYRILAISDDREYNQKIIECELINE